MNKVTTGPFIFALFILINALVVGVGGAQALSRLAAL